MTNDNHNVLYIGMTTDPVRKVTEQRGEKQIKAWSRAKKVTLVDRLNPRWFDLAENIPAE